MTLPNQTCLIQALYKTKGESIDTRADQDDWLALHAISIVENMPLGQLINMIDETKPSSADLTAAVRVFVRSYLHCFTKETTPEAA